ncbi:aspartic endopeptidase [Exophiala viscosa]|uniref:Aspartic endopeptidase n=1 Tax=Exophiala viscosa TaxID=2486360 RepID=A0AAN6IEG0_9EURO|nr:aspartic endopeptidase [Exophiala viscosa]
MQGRAWLSLIHILLITTVVAIATPVSVVRHPNYNANVTRISVHHNPNYHANGTKSLVHVYYKYGITPILPGPYHRGDDGILRKRQEDGTTGVVTADDQENDMYYTCPVEIGTPPQTLNLNFDTGSSDTWVWSTAIPETELASTSGETLFDPSKSSTFHNMPGSTWQIRYGDGSSASGTVGTDVVKIGSITIEGQAVELANQLSRQLLNDSVANGLLGLGFSFINNVIPIRVQTPLENMILQNDIPTNQELFTCYLGSYKDVNDPDGGRSFYSFGDIDESVIPSGQELCYTPINNTRGFWMFDSPSVIINGEQYDLPKYQAVADTGTTLLLLPDEVCRQFYGQIPGSEYSEADQGWVYPTNTSPNDLPDFSVAVGTCPITIDKEHIGFAPSLKPNMTFGGIQSPGNLKFGIFGDIFLQNVYAVFDGGILRFGVVQRADPTPDGQQS